MRGTPSVLTNLSLGRKLALLGAPAALALFALIAAACGGGGDDDSTSDAPTPEPRPAETAQLPDTAPGAPADTAPPAATFAGAGLVQGAGRFDWQITRVDQGVKPDIALDLDGTPLIAYMLERMGNDGFIRVARGEGGSFVPITVQSGYLYGPLDIEISQDGAAAVAYHNHDWEDAAVATRDATGAWAVSRVPHDGHDGWDDSLAFGPAGALHLLSVDPLQFGSASGVEYARSNNPAGGDAWTVQEIGSGGQPYEWGTSLAVDQAGTVHAVFFDANEQDLVYARNEAPNEGGDWQLQTIYAQDDAGRFPVITLDDTGAPHVAFFQTDARFQPEGPVPGNIVYGTLANGAWTFETVAAVDDHVLGFEGARRTVALRIGPDGPVLAFIDQSSVSLATRNGPSGSVWTVETVVAAAGDPFQVIGLALDPTGAPHLTFATITGNAPLNGEVWYVAPIPNS